VELLAWIVALGAAGGRAASTDFYVPSVPLRCGMGGVSWAP
jgi:protocatechuate 4,5-dioxygenase beta chain